MAHLLLLAYLYAGQFVSAARMTAGNVHAHSFPLDKLKYVTELGSGSFGDAFAYKVTCAEKGESRYVAVKSLRYRLGNRTRTLSEFWKEVGFLEEMRGKSDYVVSLVGKPAVSETGCDGKPCMMTEFLNMGELQKVVDRRVLDDKLKATFLWQLTKGLVDMHNAGIVHMDVSLNNALVNCEEDDESLCYVAHIDLGLAAHRNPAPHEICIEKGSKQYVAPEVFDGAAFRCIPANDIWSMGVLVHYLFLQRWPPFYLSSMHKQKVKEWLPKVKSYASAIRCTKKRSFCLPAMLDSAIGSGLRAQFQALLETISNTELRNKVFEILSKTLVLDLRKRISSGELLVLAAELLKIAVPDEEEFNRITMESPVMYGAKTRAPKCLEK